MADRSVATTDTIETLRTTFNSLAGDIGDISDLTGAIVDGTDFSGAKWYYTVCPDGTNSGEVRDCF